MTTIQTILARLQEILTAKNAAYGNSAHKIPVLAPELSEETAILVRMSDKISRIVSLRNGAKDNGEALEDTILDLAGYCVLWLTLRANKQTAEPTAGETKYNPENFRK